MMDSNFKQVQKEILYVYKNTAFFRKQMEQAGFSPKDILEPSDMLRIPPTVKKDYCRNFPVGVIASGYNLTA